MKDISFQEKELKILREAVDEATSILGQKMAQSPDILSIIQIIKNFKMGTSPFFFREY